jgi:hypothetical protein
MGNLPEVIHMATTDPGFRAALVADPEGALAKWDLDVSEEELAVLSKAAHLLALPSERLLGHILSAADGPEQQWPWIAPPAQHATGAS